MKMPRVERYGDSAGERFRSVLDLETHTHDQGAIMLGWNTQYNLFMVAQCNGDQKVAFADSESMRIVANEILEAADKWDRGEIAGMKPTGGK